MTLECEKPLLLLKAFTRGLSHKLRTPLSVISNELSYLSSVVDSAECERGTKKCREMSGILTDASFKCLSRLEKAPVALRSLLHDYIELSVIQIVCSPEFEVEKITEDILGDREALLEGFKLVSAFAAVLSDKSENKETPLEALLDLAKGNGERCVIKMNLPVFSRAETYDLEEAYESFTELFCFTLNTDYYLPPMIDSIFWANDCRLRLVPRRITGGFSLNINFEFEALK